MFDVEELEWDYRRACRYEERLADGARGLVLVEDHRAALERLRQELAEALAIVEDPGQRQALEAAIAASLARAEIG